LTSTRSTDPNLDQCVARPEVASVAIIGVWVDENTSQTEIAFRKNGDSGAGMSFTARENSGGNNWHSFQVMVPLDDTEIFEVQKSIGGAGAAQYTLYLQAYIV